MDRFAVHSLYRNRNRNRTPQSKPQRWLCGFCCFVFVVVAVLFAVLEFHHLDRNRNRNRILFSDLHCNRNSNHILFSHLHRNRNRNHKPQEDRNVNRNDGFAVFAVSVDPVAVLVGVFDFPNFDRNRNRYRIWFSA